jgi:pimeloyl-ACP methyl ester carboxylesterase
MLRLGLLAVSALLAGCAVVYDPIEQSFLYRHRPVAEERFKAILERDSGIEEVRLVAVDGTRLHGILKRAPAARAGERYPLVIVFGGVARETSWMASWGDKPDAWGWLMVNYRGYGLSEGRPTQEILVEDAQRIYDWAAARPDVDPTGIVVLGRSLGSYVAVSLATQRPVRALILATPFDSFAALAARRYPYLPSGLLVGGRYDSVALAPKITVPALFVIADQDEVTPPPHGEALARAWAGPKSVVRLSGGHRVVEWRQEYWRAIGEFLQPLAAAPAGQRALESAARAGTVQK